MPAIDPALIAILKDGLFHSGTTLSRQLGLSRAGIWKRIQQLAEVGLRVHSVPGRGYRLEYPLDLLNEESIRRQLEPAVLALVPTISLMTVVDSTNQYLQGDGGLVHDSGSLALAEYQVQGRGRQGHPWIAPFGASICLSLLWQFQDSRAIGGLSLAVAVALIRAFKALDIEGVCLKWPNDLYCAQKKLGGILLEVKGEAHGVTRVVIGVGLNVYLPDRIAAQIDQPVTDLMQVAGTLPSRNRLVAEILNHLIPILGAFESTGLEPYLAEWRDAHGFQGHPASLHLGDSSLNGVIQDITAEGLLQFRTAEGETRLVSAGEIRLRVNS